VLFGQLQPAIKHKIVGVLLPNLPDKSVYLVKLALVVARAKSGIYEVTKRKTSSGFKDDYGLC